MIVLVSSPEQDKPVRTLWSIEDYIRDPAGATTLNTSSIKTLNGDMSVTALLHISSSSSSSSYQETVEQLTAQEHVQTDSVDHSKRNGLLTVNKEYVFFTANSGIKGAKPCHSHLRMSINQQSVNN